MIEGETNYIAYGGVTKISGVKFTGTPGSTFKISFKGDGINEDLPENVAYQQSNSLTTIENSLYVEIRECEVGEYFTEDG